MLEILMSMHQKNVSLRVVGYVIKQCAVSRVAIFDEDSDPVSASIHSVFFWGWVMIFAYLHEDHEGPTHMHLCATQQFLRNPIVDHIVDIFVNHPTTCGFHFAVF